MLASDRRHVPRCLDIADVVERLNAETVVADGVRQLRVGHRVLISRGH